MVISSIMQRAIEIDDIPFCIQATWQTA